MSDIPNAHGALKLTFEIENKGKDIPQMSRQSKAVSQRKSRIGTCTNRPKKWWIIQTLQYKEHKVKNIRKQDAVIHQSPSLL